MYATGKTLWSSSSETSKLTLPAISSKFYGSNGAVEYSTLWPATDLRFSRTGCCAFGPLNIAICQELFPGFWGKNIWSSNSLILNLLNYSVWSIQEENISSTPYTIVDALKAAMTLAGDEIMRAKQVRKRVLPKRSKQDAHIGALSRLFIPISQMCSCEFGYSIFRLYQLDSVHLMIGTTTIAADLLSIFRVFFMWGNIIRRISTLRSIQETESFSNDDTTVTSIMIIRYVIMFLAQSANAILYNIGTTAVKGSMPYENIRYGVERWNSDNSVYTEITLQLIATDLYHAGVEERMCDILQHNVVVVLIPSTEDNLDEALAKSMCRHFQDLISGTAVIKQVDLHAQRQCDAHNCMTHLCYCSVRVSNFMLFD
ncbi:hypothetical protein KIN20_004320 [Parelaphostrongylus tenuis]|uniref:Uncharacterized protein n=1 Tax=Parelaphostrongylus tenuis TaxID=148309 RepID=A0AAD5QJ76_PARTN|nr:hypothetical protein KIN20_004320 [Parelaphostrongylus tenuis]